MVTIAIEVFGERDERGIGMEEAEAEGALRAALRAMAEADDSRWGGDGPWLRERAWQVARWALWGLAACALAALGGEAQGALSARAWEAWLGRAVLILALSYPAAVGIGAYREGASALLASRWAGRSAWALARLALGGPLLALWGLPYLLVDIAALNSEFKEPSERSRVGGWFNRLWASAQKPTAWPRRVLEPTARWVVGGLHAWQDIESQRRELRERRGSLREMARALAAPSGSRSALALWIQAPFDPGWKIGQTPFHQALEQAGRLEGVLWRETLRKIAEAMRCASEGARIESALSPGPRAAQRQSRRL